MRELAEFLDTLSLGQYLSVFSDNDIDFETLHLLTDEDLISLGVSLGHRRKLAATLNSHSVEDVVSTTTPKALAYRELAERRQLTVMFCDLVGSTNLSAKLDPEELRTLMQQYHSTASRAIVDHGGHVAKLLGDGILAYFGFPDANENDCERAVRAAESVVAEVAHIVPDVRDMTGNLEVRIGIATGMVVIGEMTAASVTDFDSVVGETPNLAARLQSIAAPGTIIVSSETHDLVGAIFEYEELGKQSIAGFPDPLPAWRVLQEKHASSRFDAKRGLIIPDLVGRTEEVDLIRRRWAAVQGGSGSVVFVSGDAGIGKSRLLQNLRSDIAKDCAARLQFQCSQFHMGTAFAPIVNHFEHAAGFAHEDSPADRLAKLKPVLGTTPSEILVALLRLQDARAMSDIEPDPELRRERVLAELMAMIERRCTKGPALILVEDLHWIDDSTLEFVNRLVEAATRLPVLLVLTARPGLNAAWLDEPHVSFMMLKRLDRNSVKALIKAVTRGRTLPEDVQMQIEQRTDGVPLFVEELTRSILSSDWLEEKGGRLVTTGVVPPQAIPMTLQEALMARLDKLSSAKDVAQLGAVVGRHFTIDLIMAISSKSEEMLVSALKTLELEGLVTRRDAGANTVFEFRHALIQETAYGSLLRSRRAELHERIARHLIQQTANLEPAVIAHHLNEAGLRADAIEYWIAAGDHSIETAGFVEALTNYTRALSQLRETPPDAERYEQEIHVLLAMGPCQVQVLGPATEEVHQTYTAAVQLSEGYGRSEDRFKALWGLWFYYFMLGAVTKMHELALKLIPLAREAEDEALELEGHHCEWAALSLLGDFSNALDSTEKGIEAYDEEKHHWMTFHYGGHDPGLCAQSLKAVNLCVLGYPDRAKNVADIAIANALRLNHGYSVLETLFCSLIVMMLRSEYDAIKLYAPRLIELADAQRVPLEARDLANGFLGWVETETGAEAEGLARMGKSISGWQAFWGAWCFPLDATYALAVARKGDTASAMKIIDDASEIGGDTGGHWWNAEFHRVRGNILWMTDASNQSAVVASFESAIEAARERQAKLFELRACTDLARFHYDCGDVRSAHGLVTPLLGQVAEGQDLPDFLAAKALLELCLQGKK